MIKSEASLVNGSWNCVIRCSQLLFVRLVVHEIYSHRLSRWISLLRGFLSAGQKPLNIFFRIHQDFLICHETTTGMKQSHAILIHWIRSCTRCKRSNFVEIWKFCKIAASLIIFDPTNGAEYFMRFHAISRVTKADVKRAQPWKIVRRLFREIDAID